MKNKIRRSVFVLEQNIKNIRSVSEWAYIMGYNSPKTFSRLFRNEFGLRPKRYMDQIRLKAIMDSFVQMPDDKYYCIALNVGLEDEQALYKFVKNHLGLSPTDIKTQVLKEQKQTQIAA